MVNNITINPIVFFGVFLGFFAGLLGVNFWLEKKRREALQAAARQLGFSFVANPLEDVRFRFGNFNVFNQGYSQRAYNVLEGTLDNQTFCVFDYRYTIGHGKNSSTYLQSIIIAQTLGVNLPQFVLCYENILYHFGEVLGFRDIDFATNPQFSKRYRLKGPDEQAIRRVFTPTVLNVFERKQKVPSVEASANALLYYYPSKRIEPQLLRQSLEEVSEVARAFGETAGWH